MTVWQDLRFAVRLLLKRPGFAALAVATFAVGIAAATAIYSVVDGLLIRPLPYRDADRIVQVLSHRMEGKTHVRAATMARPFFLAIRDSARALSVVGGYDSFSNLTRRRLSMTIEGGQGVAELLGTRISPAFLSTLGRAPALGRVFEPGEERPGHNGVVIISHRAWRAHFGGDRAVLGRMVRLDNRPYSIVGVMPHGFDFPDAQTDFWIPLTPAPVPPPSAPRSDSPDSAYADGVFGRLRDGVEVQAAAAEIESILRRTDAELAAQRHRPVEDSGFPSWMPRRADVVSMKDELIAPARPLLRVLSVAVAGVVLIACANGVNLLLAGAVSRQREMATRVALGASPLHLIRQGLVESLLLSLAGGLLGIPLAYAAIRVVARVAPADLPRIQEVGMNMPLLLSALALSFAMGIGAGLVPALSILSRGHHVESLLRQGAAAATAGAGSKGFGLRRAIVVGELAVAVVLVAGAGLLIRSLASLSKVDIGYDAHGVLAFQVIVPAGQDDRLLDFYAEVIERLGSIPGVEAAAATDVLPVSGASGYRFVLGGLPTPAAPGDFMVMRLVSPGYFRAMGIRVLAGRTFSERSSGREVLLSAELARRYFGNVNPIGRIVGQGVDTYQVVGIVADVRHEGFEARVRPEYYLDLRESALIAATRPYFVVRTARAPADLVPTVRAVVRQLDPAAGVGANVSAMTDLVSESVSRPRFNAAVLSAFAAIAVLLAAIAVHGVMAYAVAQRSREIAVRVALGARRTDVIRLVLRQGALMTTAGTAIGLAAALAVTRYMQAMLFGVTPFDLTTFVAVPPAVALVAALASLAPVHRATKVDPAIALRAEQ